MSGVSPSSVVRCMCRRYFVSSNGVAQCCAQRLSQSASEPTSQEKRQVNSGWIWMRAHHRMLRDELGRLSFSRVSLQPFLASARNVGFR